MQQGHLHARSSQQGGHAATGRRSLSGPVVLRGRTAQSHVLFGPHETNLARRRDISDRHVAYYARRAAGGAGVIVTEVASVHDSDHPYERAPLATDAAPGWADVVRACRPHGALVLAGLGHAGGQGSSAYTRGALWAPSRVADPGTREVPAEIEQAGIDALVAGFGAAAALAADAGLDGVEVNAGQHSILRQFLSGLTNHRTDAYGTDRTRLLREVLAAVRAGLGNGVLGLRLCCDELAPWAGIIPDRGAEIVAEVAAAVDYVVPVRGSALSVWATRPDEHEPPGFNDRLCTHIRAALGGAAPVVLQGSVVDPGEAQRALDEGVADLVEMTRAQIADPDLVAHVRAGTPERIRPCTLSNQRTAVRDPRNPIVSDDAEPRSGHETEDPPVEGADPVARDVLVVGGGPAGLEAARVLALRGHRVRLVEREAALGGALRLAAAVPGRTRMRLLVGWWKRELARLGVEVETGVAADPAMLDAAEQAGVAVLLATGGRPGPLQHDAHGIDAAGSGGSAALPPTGGTSWRADAASFMAAVLAAGSAAAVLDPLPPGPVVVHDPFGDSTGVGIAEQVAAAGRRAVLVTPAQVAGVRLARTGDLVPANVRLQRAGVVRELRSRLVAAGDGRAVLEHVWTGERREVDCAFVIDCGARLPGDELWRARPHLPRAGDCVAPRTVHEAVLEARRCARALADPDVRTRGPGRRDSRTPMWGLADSDVGTRGGTAQTSASPDDRVRESLHPRPRVPTHERSDSRAPTQRLARTNAATRGGGGTHPASRGKSARESLEKGARVATNGGLLFSPLRVGPLELRNRVVFCAHLTNAAVDGLPTEQRAAYYAARAAGGAGLIVTEEHSVHPGDRPYEKLLRGYDSAIVEGQRRLTGAVHAHGVPVLAQLNHNGGQSSGVYSRQPLWAPSPVPDPLFGEVPKEMTAAEIREVAAAYARAAELAADGGFDGVEIQCSQASLLRQFLSPLTNHRTDAYGGDLRGRARIVREVVAAVREAVGPDRAVGVRLCGDEGLPGGTTLAEAVATARLLDADGLVDYLNTSVGVATATLHMVEPPMPVPPAYALPVAAAIRAAVRVPVVAVGRFDDHAAAERALAEGGCDLVGVVRGQIADPAFAAPAGPGRACIACNQECSARVGQNQRLGCLVNPRAGRESVVIPPVRGRRHVLVVGGGPAGLSAAATAAGRGHRVTLCEREQRTGGQVELAARAPARTEFAAVVRDLHAECVRLGVEIRTGAPVDPARIERERPDVVVLATGARPARPAWAFDRVVDVREVLSGAVSPAGSVLVHDELGFHQATSTAEHLAALGCAVEIATPGMAVGQDLGLTLDMELFHRRARAAGIVMTTDRAVLAAEDAAGDGTGVLLTVLDHAVGAVSRVRYDWVVTALPGEPEDELWHALRGQGIEVHRVGDCLAPRRADAAVREGYLVGVAL